MQSGSPVAAREKHAGPNALLGGEQEQAMKIERSRARERGWRMAAKVAMVTIGGITLAAAGTARAFESPSGGGDRATATSADDQATLPLEGWLRARDVKSCGCSPCWGPPAPPRRSRRARATRSSKRGRR
jgi:hypothetical protein